MFSKKCGIMIIHDCILFLEFSSWFPKNAVFILWLFIIVYCFWNLVHDFQKMRYLYYGYSLLYIVFGIYHLISKKCGIMIIHDCILFLEFSSWFPKMRYSSYGYSLLYIVFGIYLLISKKMRYYEYSWLYIIFEI